MRERVQGEVLVKTCALFWAVMASFYVLHPLKDACAVWAGGVQRLPAIYYGALLLTIACDLAFAKRLKSTNDPLSLTSNTYSTLCMLLLAFYVAFLWSNWWEMDMRQGIASAFFLWMGVQSLLPVALCWSCIVDVFKEREGREAFAWIGCGGSVGQLTGSALSRLLVEFVHPEHLLPLSACFLLLAAFLCSKLSTNVEAAHANRRSQGEDKRRKSDCSAMSSEESQHVVSIGALVKNPYVMCICAYLCTQTLLNSFVYFRKIELVQAVNGVIGDDDQLFGATTPTALFATMNMIISGVTLGVQLLLSTQLLLRLPLWMLLCAVPLLSLITLLSLFHSPSLRTFAIVEIIRKSCNYAVARPARELLYVVLPHRRLKYRVKSFVETVVYKTGDGLAASAMGLFLYITGNVAGAAPTFFGCAACLLWMSLGISLGAQQRSLSQAQTHRHEAH